MLKKCLAMLLAVIMVLSLGACAAETDKGDSKPEESPKTDGASPPKEKVTIDFAMLALANEIEGWTAMVDAANKQLADQNIEIKISKIPGTGWSEYYQKIVAQMASNTAPDIGRIAESLMPVLISKNQAVDLTKRIEDDLDMTQYLEKTFQNSAYQNGKYYGLPSGVYQYILYYNKDMFDAAGIAHPSSDWNNPISMETIRENAKTLTRGEGGNKIFGFSAGPYMATVGMLNLTAGGSNVFDGNGKPAMNDDAAKYVYKWFDDMLRVDGSMPRPTDTKVMGSFDMFMSGRLAMTIDGTWMMGALNGIKDFKPGLAAIPSKEGQSYTSQFVDSFVMFSGTKYEEEAWKALKGLISEEGFTALSKTGVGGMPIHKDVMASVLETNYGGIFEDSDVSAYKDAFDHLIAVPYNDFYQDADQKVNNTMDEWLLGRINSDEFANKVQKILEGYINK